MNALITGLTVMYTEAGKLINMQINQHVVSFEKNANKTARTLVGYVTNCFGCEL